MSVEERCVHQGVDTGRHVLFNEQWERCKKCTYNLEENRKCFDYAKSYRDVPDKQVASENNLIVVYSVARSDLEREAIA
jgi:hypothetical protein